MLLPSYDIKKLNRQQMRANKIHQSKEYRQVIEQVNILKGLIGSKVILYNIYKNMQRLNKYNNIFFQCDYLLMSDQMRQMMEKIMQQLQKQQLMINNLTKELAEQKSKNNLAYAHMINPTYYSLPPISNVHLQSPIPKMFQKVQEKNTNNSNIQLIQKETLVKLNSQIKPIYQKFKPKKQQKEQISPRERINFREVRLPQEEMPNIEKIERKQEKPKSDKLKKEEKQDRYPKNHRLVCDNKPRRDPINWTKIGTIEPGDDNLNIMAQVISAEPLPNGNKIRLILGDETGIVRAFIWNHECFVVGKTIVLFKGEACVVKEHIEIQLMERGKMDEARREVREVNIANDISARQWVEQS